MNNRENSNKGKNNHTENDNQGENNFDTSEDNLTESDEKLELELELEQELEPKKEAYSQQQGTILSHIAEIRKRLIYIILIFACCSFIAYSVAEQIFNFMQQPLVKAFATNNIIDKKIIATELTETFFTYIKIAILCGFLLSTPFIIWHIYAFLKPGLYKREEILIVPFLLASPILAFAGAIFAFYFIMPLAYNFLVQFATQAPEIIAETTTKSATATTSSTTAITEQATSMLANSMPIIYEIRVKKYFDISLRIIFAFAISFQLPLILLLLLKFKVISVEGLKKFRKYALVIMLTIAAILTPPDVISQIGLTIPLYLLYEATIAIWQKTPPNKR